MKKTIKKREKRDSSKIKLNKKSNKIIMDILHEHNSAMNLEVKNKKFVNFLYELCKSSHVDSNTIMHNLDYFPVNADEYSNLHATLFMDQVVVDEIRKKLNFCYNVSMTIKSKSFLIKIYTNISEKINIQAYIKQIKLLLCLCLSYVKDETPMTYNITIYNTTLKKGLYHGFKNMIEPKHINSGYYFFDPTMNQGNVVIYRKEEWFKVLIHELFHNFNLDFSTSRICYKSMFSDVFFVKSEMLLNEAFVEFWARTINCALVAYKNINQITLEQFTSVFNLNINIETIFALHQAIHLLEIFGLNYEQIINKKNAKSTELLYRENTNAFVYYVVTPIFMYNFDSTVQWFTNNEFNMLKYNKDEREVMIFNYYLKSLISKKSLLSIISDIEKKMIKNAGLRMCAFEIDVE